MKKTIFKSVTLMRSFFKTNSAGDDEFDYVLSELGVPEEEREDIDEVEIRVEEIEY